MLKYAEVGVHYVQVDLQQSLGVCAYLAIVVSIKKQHKRCISEEIVIAMLEDNRGVAGCAQKKECEHDYKTSNRRIDASIILRSVFQARKIILFLSKNNVELFLS